MQEEVKHQDELDQLIDELGEAKKLVSEASRAHEKAKKKKEELQNQVIKILQDRDKVKHSARKYEASWALHSFPTLSKDLEEKGKFFNYLKKEGLYDEMITVNAARLKSFTDSRKDEETDLAPDIPGVSYYERPTISLTKIKTKRK